MTDIIKPSDTQPEAPKGEGSSSKRGGSRAAVVAVVAVVAGLAAVALLVVVALAAAFLVRFDSSGGDTLEPETLPPVEGAPPAHWVMIVEETGLTGEVARQSFEDAGGEAMMQGRAIQSDSIAYVFAVRTPFETYEFYQWLEVLETTDAGLPSECFGGFADSGSFSSCSDSDGSQVSVPSIGTGSSSDGVNTSFDVTVTDLVDDAEWVVVNTESGVVIAARVVDGTAYLQWPGTSDANPELAEPMSVRALDADFNEVWSDSIG